MIATAEAHAEDTEAGLPQFNLVHDVEEMAHERANRSNFVATRTSSFRR